MILISINQNINILLYNHTHTHRQGDEFRLISVLDRLERLDALSNPFTVFIRIRGAGSSSNFTRSVHINIITERGA